MLNTASDIINEVLVRNARTTTDSFITDQMLEDWIREGNNYCTTQYKWSLSQVRDYTTTWSGTEEVDYSSFGISFKADSIRYLIVGGKKLDKRNFEDYQLMREERPEANDRVYTDFARILYINPRADVSGSVAAFGQYTPQLDPTDPTATTIFSTFDEEGNEAIVEKMSGYMKRREHMTDEAELHDQRADMLLQKLYKKEQDEQYKYQTGPDSDGMFTHFDVLDGAYRQDLFRRNQF